MRRLAALIGVVSIVLLTTAPPADAHTVTGVKPTNYKSRVLAVRPAVHGLRFRLLELGRRVQLTNRSGADVVVLDATGAPFVHVRDGATVRWRDKRTRYEGPAQTRSSTHVVATWTIDMRRGDAPIRVTGLITYVKAPSPMLWVAVTLALVAVTISAAWSSRWGRWLSIALALMIASDAMQGFGTAAATYDSFASQLGRILLGGLVTTGAWVAGVLALGSLQRNHEGGLVTAAGVGIVIAAFSGATDVGVFGRSQVATVFPAATSRLAVACAIGLGVGLLGAAIVLIARDPSLRPRAIDATPPAS